jgi:ribonuclease BN (tRNA processing enzyme)
MHLEQPNCRPGCAVYLDGGEKRRTRWNFEGVKMKLVLLGTAGFIPTDRAQTACLMLPEVGILLDAGTGLYRMSQYLQTADLDVYLSHAHGDHTRGLVFLFASFFINEINRLEAEVDDSQIGAVVAAANDRLHTVRVHAAQTALNYLQKEYEPHRMNWHLLKDSEPLPQGGRLTSFSVSPQDEVGFRLDWPGHSLAYVTDTIAAPDAKYLEPIRGVDLLVHECNGPDRLAKMMARINHSHTSAVAGVAAQAQVGRLILVHKNPIPQWSIEADLDRAREIFPATEIGEDGMEIDF